MVKPFQMVQSDDCSDLYLFGDIVESEYFEEDVGPNSLQKALNDCTSDVINVHIDSYGGATSAGIAIYNMLKNSGKLIRTIAEGFACSAASLIFCAGDERIMRKSSLLMIHNAWTMAQGNADELRKQADDLEKISTVAAKIYVENSNLEEAKVNELLAAETWITPDEAVEYGLATSACGDDDKKKSDAACSSVREIVYNALVGRKTEQEEPESVQNVPKQELDEPEPEQEVPEEEKTPFQRVFGNFK